jgi:hypothetical protein
MVKVTKTIRTSPTWKAGKLRNRTRRHKYELHVLQNLQVKLYAQLKGTWPKPSLCDRERLFGLVPRRMLRNDEGLIGQCLW